ncbi:hypothetical protein [Adhaeribacter pallidiroseus]|uniref:Uncharacterized protein n=1 Tax=Adhaeribacter pallidiroseus TaxID=2072847 RepID=A0A369QLI2_9BACT|nr:hypothetical protein [Adhaeribacter pallidiroseus]RDC63709.1 hypothetical protein AHMF7616_02317 [Adhaeribacter pallidiroseus]
MALFLLWSIPFIGLLIFLYLAAYYSIYLRKAYKKKHLRKKAFKKTEEPLDATSYQVSDQNTQPS